MSSGTADLWNLPHVVYRAYGISGELIYVGVTYNLHHRIKGHESASWWWNEEVHQVVAEDHPNRESALVAELIAIKTEDPKRNQQGKIKGQSDQDLRDRLIHQLQSMDEEQQKIDESGGWEIVWYRYRARIEKILGIPFGSLDVTEGT